MFDRNLLKLPGMKATLAALLATDAIVALLTCGQALALAFAIAGLWEGNPLEAQLPLIGAFLGCFGGRQVAGFLRDEALDRYALKTAGALRDRLLERTFLQRPLLPAEAGSAAVIQAATEGIDQIEGYIRMMPPKLCGLAALAIPLLCAEFALDWISGAILLVTAPVIFYFMQLLGRQARDRAAAQYASYRRLSNHFIDTLRGLPTLIAFRIADREDGRIFDASEKLRHTSMGTIATATLSSALLDLTATLGVAAVAMMLAFRLLDGSMALSIALAALMLAPEFYTPLRTFAADFHASLDAKQALAELERLLNAPVAQPLPGDCPAWNEGSVLEARDIGFSYAEDADNPALDGISFELHEGRRLAIIGPSGSGKTTLVDLIAGFSQPACGDFAIDGRPLASLDHGTWTSLVHYIPQQPFIFHGTLRDNIALYSPDADDGAVREALETVGLGPWADSLPEGIRTAIGDGGRGLSGGQAQRIALARICLDPRPILIFDEPTAHLDIETELELKERILPLMEGRTVVFATHRLHWLDSMDAVLKLENGRMAAREVEGC